MQEYRFDRLGERLPLLEKYAPGTEHTCKVDPTNEDSTYLKIVTPFIDVQLLPNRIANKSYLTRAETQRRGGGNDDRK